VATGKILNLGGIDNRPPKANQSTGRFRVARNVYPTPDGRLIPRYDCSATATPSNAQIFKHLTSYEGDLVSVVGAGDDEILKVYRNGTQIPKNFNLFNFVSSQGYWPQNTTSYRRNNTTYILSPDGRLLLKYDGVEVGRACDAGATLYTASKSSVAPTKFVKIIAHSLDFDNNEIWSDAVTFSMGNADLVLDLQAGFFGSVVAPNIVTDGQVVVHDAGIIGPTMTNICNNMNYFVPKLGTSVTYDSINQEFSVTTDQNDTSILDPAQIGSYVFVLIEGFDPSIILSIPFDYRNYAYGLALKVKQNWVQNAPLSTVGTIKLDINDAYYLDQNRQWQKANLKPTLANLNSVAAIIKWGTREVITIWASPTQNGVYFFQGIRPVFPKNANPVSVTIIPNVAIPATPTAANASPAWGNNIIDTALILNDIYDVNTTGLSPNSNTDNQFGGNWYVAFYCMTVYQDCLLLANDELIWFSNTATAGTFEQLAASNFLKVGDTEFGRITSICGTSDFLIVCRERKVYYVNGNIATGNYRVQEISECEIGAWSNVSTFLVKDTVIMVTAIGVFQISDGGRCVKISENCPKNFSFYDSMNVNEDVVFRLEGTIALPKTPTDNPALGYTGIEIAYDEYRDLLVIMQRKPGNPCLVIHMKNGEFYEWEGIYNPLLPASYGNCLTFIDGNYYVGGINNTVDFVNPPLIFSQILKENKLIDLSYILYSPVKLYTSWLTAGEPSLEKALLQLKMFGRFQSDGTTSSINVAHYKDWDFSTKITNAQYFPINTSASLNSQTQYSHKKRLNSDKVLSASVGFEITSPKVSFELESIEVEFNPIQQGMKK